MMTNSPVFKKIATGAGLLYVGYSLFREFTKYHFRNKVVLITGGSRGLGLELGRVLAAKGARLAICARSVEQLRNAKTELRNLGAQVITFTGDISDPTFTERVTAETVKYFGRIDVLINNAGIIQVGPFQTMTRDDFEKSMQTNFWGAYNMIESCLPFFRQQKVGRIVNISSIGGKVALPHLLPYTASKFALTGFSEGLHAELKTENIHVTTVVPHLMTTGSPRNVTVKGQFEDEYAWFKIADSSPLLAQQVTHSAEKIVTAIEYGESETTLAFTATLARVTQGIAPSWVSLMMRFANQLLPSPTSSTESKKGSEAESRKSRGPVSSRTDRAAVRNNEI